MDIKRILIAFGSVLLLFFGLVVSVRNLPCDSAGADKVNRNTREKLIEKSKPAPSPPANGMDIVFGARTNVLNAEEYMAIYNNIEGGTEAERAEFASQLFKGGYRHDPSFDNTPIVLHATVSRKTGLPLIEMPTSKIHRKYANDMVAEKKFKEELTRRQRANEGIESKNGMLTVSQILNLATEACPVNFDSGQPPAVDLIREIYHVTLYEERRPGHAVSIHVARIRIDARTGEVLGIDVRDDLKHAADTTN